MRIFVQIILVLTALFVIFTTLSNHKSHGGRAWKKIALILFSLLMLIAVLFPEITNALANTVGVGRGADLLLYATVVAFILYVLNSYIQQKDKTDTLHKLARKVALIDANNRYKDIRK